MKIKRPRNRGVISCLLLLLAAALMVTACGPDGQEKPVAERPAAGRPITAGGCRSCHSVDLDDPHKLPCADCHAGDEEAAGRDDAHKGLIARPAHPDHMRKSCGGCHAGLVEAAARSLHFTLKNEVNRVREVFGAEKPLTSLVDIPVEPDPATPLELADDMLRRRCLRCHVYYRGDPYPETIRGTGCAACHLVFNGGVMQSHAFQGAPVDRQCLHCHYGNVVGADYYGRFEHDYHLDYRTPYRPESDSLRPYGVEYHELAPDVHMTSGLACIDCHSGHELMATAGPAASGLEPLSCELCHLWRPGQKTALDNLRVEGDTLILTGRVDGRRHPVPPARDRLHKKYGGQAACVLCHAQWSFNDQGVHLMRQDIEDYDPWSYLTVQGDHEVEDELETNLYGEGEGYPLPFMADKINGENRLGLWFKGYEQRRWARPLTGRGPDGRRTILRPVLDLHISYVNEDAEVVFDSVGAADKHHGLRPYTPHTIGKAGAFFRERLGE